MSRRILCCALALLLSLSPAALQAAPLDRQTSPSIQVAPDAARPGEIVRVTVSGFTDPEQVGATLCLGILGPGQNPEQGLAPSFRVRVGEVTLGANGSGEADALMPANLSPGSYRVIVGGCPPQPDIAPLAALATTTITVIVPGLQTTYFFAEGATTPPFDTWFLLFNPDPNPVRVLMRLFQETAGPGPLLDFTIPANSRQSLFANQVRANVSFGATIVTEGDGIVAERSMTSAEGTEGRTPWGFRGSPEARSRGFSRWCPLSG